MGSICNFRQSSSTVSKMSVRVSQICRSSNTVDLSLVFADCLQNTGIKDWSLGTRVHSNKQNNVSVFDTFDLGIEKVVGAEVVRDGEVVALPELVVEAVQGV